MAKKYLSLEEAADRLGVSVEQIMRHRENGDVRGFADRGTWKFRTEDIDELGRIRQADSDPEVPMLDAEEDEIGQADTTEMPDAASVLGDEEGTEPGPTGGRGDEEVSEQPTVIRREAADEKAFDQGSDSDVRLILDDSFPAGGNQDEDTAQEIDLVTGGDSDSDVRLVEDDQSSGEDGSDSDVKLVDSDSDSDVSLVPNSAGAEAESDSDSDVKLVDGDSEAESASDPGSDSDVKLIGEAEDDVGGSDSDVSLVPATAGAPPQASSSQDEQDEDDASVFSDEGGEEEASGKTFVGSGATGPDDSGISLESQDSGISLDSDDSGIALDSGPLAGESADESEDDGLTLADANEDDEAITLGDEEGDDGLTLAEDSGISLENSSDSGLSLESTDQDQDELQQTMPALDNSALNADQDETDLEVPSLSDDDSEFDLAEIDEESEDGAGTSVLLFDEDEEADDSSQTVVKKSGEDDLASDIEEFEEADDDLEVSEDVVGEDDELDDLDVFDAEDEDFAEVESGESQAGFVAPAGGAGRIAAPVEADWGAPTFVGLLLSSALMCLCTMVVFDLVRSMWAWKEPASFNSALLEMFSGMF